MGNSFGIARKFPLNVLILQYLELRHLFLNQRHRPLHRHQHQLQLLLLDIAIMVEMIAIEKNVMEKLRVVHGAMKIKLIVDQRWNLVSSEFPNSCNHRMANIFSSSMAYILPSSKSNSKSNCSTNFMCR